MLKRIFTILVAAIVFGSGLALAGKPLDLDERRDKKPGKNKNNEPTTVVLQANNDTAATPSSVPIIIDELRNDKGVDDPGLLVSILSQPKNGSAILQADNSIFYTPAEGFSGIDTFEYDVRLQTGEQDAAMISVTVEQGTTEVVDNNECSYTVGLSWNVSNTAEVAGYYVYQGTSPGEYLDKVYVGEVFEYDFCVSAPGEYFFAASAENIYGVESELTAEVVALVP